MKPTIAGNGTVEESENHKMALHLDRQEKGYGLAQLDDYHDLARSDFLWSPPLHLSLIAQASSNNPKGTLGFGFWNDPFSVVMGQSGAKRRLPVSPQALWFFYGSPPNDIALAAPVPGHGWKAAVLRAPSIPTLLLAPAALVAIITAQLPIIRRPVMKTAIATVQADETLIEKDLAQSHRYELEWESERVRFAVDEEQLLESTITPRAPLGFVAWIDNQYAVASPEGGFKFGVIPTPEAQALHISEIEINGSPLVIGDVNHA